MFSSQSSLAGKIFSGFSLLFLFWFNSEVSLGQSIPLGSYFGEELPRTAQLLGDLSLRNSLLIRPIESSILFTGSNKSDSTHQLSDLKRPYIKNEFSLFNSKIKFGFLPLNFTSRIGTDLPINSLDGSMIPAKGFQQQFTGGVYLITGPITVQLQPEWVSAQNKSFVFFDLNSSQFELRKKYWVVSESPERFGQQTFNFKSIGQSFLRFHLGPFALRLSNENLFWGPGQFNGLIISNSAPGFRHLAFESFRPVNLGIGFLQFQLLGGILENFGDRGLPFISRRNENRYLNGLSVTFNPKWMPGLFFGIERIFQQYLTDRENSFRGWMPIFQGLQKKRFAAGFYNDSYDRLAQDQQMAISLRWVFPESHAEMYTQFARGDHAYNWRDLLLSPDHTRAYIAGFKKIYKIGGSEKFFQIRTEISKSEESTNYLTRYGTSGGFGWGSHIPITQGSTHFGQQLGNVYGPGGNSETLEFSLLKGLNKYSILFDRFEHQMDYYRQAQIRNNKINPWVDYGTQLSVVRSFGNFILNSNVKFILIQNYQWGVLDATCDCKLNSNLSFEFSGLYRF